MKSYAFVLSMLLAGVARPAAATSVCEQLILPGIGPYSWAPRAPVKLSVRAAFSLGQTLAKLSDAELLTTLDRALPAGFMISGASAATVGRAVAAGRFAGEPLAPEDLRRTLRRTDHADGAALASTRWMRGVTTQDLYAFGGPPGLTVARETARAAAEGSYLLGALGLNAVRYHGLIPSLSLLAQGEGAARDLKGAARVTDDEDVRRLLLEVLGTYGEPSDEQLEDAVERRGFLLVFRDSSYQGRAHVEDPEGPGSVVALGPHQGLTQAELFAVIPQSKVDQRDLKRILATGVKR